MATVCVVGTTSWGTTLANIAAQNGHIINLLSRTKIEAERLNYDRTNERFFPGVKFPDNLQVTSNVKEAFSSAELVFIAVPSYAFKENLYSIKDFVRNDAYVVSATKGLDSITFKRMTELLQDGLNSDFHGKICALSGPNLAKEIMLGKPSSTVVASKTIQFSVAVQNMMNAEKFRVYTSDDVVGVEFGGALKNIIALGAGICDGLSLGDNAKAAFITRGLFEISRLAVQLGANPMTIAGLAGMGDLIATCASKLSRNHFVGEQLALGRSIDEINKSLGQVAEGFYTSLVAKRLSENLNVDTPIIDATYNILYRGVSLSQVMEELLLRIPTSEID